MSTNQKKVKTMSMTDLELKNAQETQYALKQAKHTEPNKPEYWLWSDIAKIHNHFLDPNRSIAIDLFHAKLQDAVHKVVPEFRDVFPKPVHIKSISNQKLNYEDSPDMEKNLDQEITRVGCEFFFQKFYNTEFSQAFFLFPNTSVTELVHKADEVNLYRVSKKIQNMTKILVAIIASKTIDYKKIQPFPQIWHTLWSELFGTDDIDGLKAKYNITTNAPTTHLMPSQWIYIYYMLQDVVNYIDNAHAQLDLETILKHCRESARFQRDSFKKHTEKYPEEFLTPTDFKETVKKIETERRNFWIENYLQSFR